MAQLHPENSIKLQLLFQSVNYNYNYKVYSRMRCNALQPAGTFTFISTKTKQTSLAVYKKV